MEIEIVEIENLKEPEWNYNKHPQKQLDELKKSLDQFGQFKNIVVWRDGLVIAGNGLVEAARQKGLKELKAIVLPDLSEDQAKALLVADNALPHGGDFDADMLENLIGDIEMDVPGIDDFLDDIGLSDFEIIDDLGDDAEKSGNDNDVYGATCSGFRFGKVLAYIKDIEASDFMNRTSEVILKKTDYDQSEINKICTAIIHRMMGYENIFLPKE